MERVVRTDLEVFLEAVEVHLVVPVQGVVAGAGGIGFWGFGLGFGEEAVFEDPGCDEFGLERLV